MAFSLHDYFMRQYFGKSSKFLKESKLFRFSLKVHLTVANVHSLFVVQKYFKMWLDDEYVDEKIPFLECDEIVRQYEELEHRIAEWVHKLHKLYMRVEDDGEGDWILIGG
jgi:hypothetical protein